MWYGWLATELRRTTSWCCVAVGIRDECSSWWDASEGLTLSVTWLSTDQTSSGAVGVESSASWIWDWDRRVAVLAGLRNGDGLVTLSQSGNWS